jgi:TonB family protein
VTDISGRFEIAVNDNATLSFSFIGYKTYEQTISPNQNEVDIELTLDTTQLSEVVVTGARALEQPKEPFELAHPEMGYNEFKRYLESSIRYPEEAIEKQIEGRVTVEFTIESNGTLTEFNVVRGIGSGCDDELIRLIKDSKWVPAKKNSVPVKDKAKVQLKFDLPK